MAWGIWCSGYRVFVGFDEAVLQVDDLLGYGSDVIFMCDDQNGYVIVVYFFENFYYFVGGFGIQGVCWFICQYDFRLCN